MAQYTALTIIGVYGPVRSFAAKTPAAGARTVKRSPIISQFTYWEIWYCDPEGRRISLLDQVSRVGLGLAMTANGVGAWRLTLPPWVGAPRVDGWVEFWRAPAGGALRRVRVGRIREYVMQDGGDGNDMMVWSGPDQLDILQQRIVAYAAGTAQAYKTGYGGDLLRALVRENLGSSAGTGRVSNYIEVGADTGTGVSMTKGFAWQNLLSAMQEVCEASRQGGTELYFDLEPYTLWDVMYWRLVVNEGQPGADRTESSGVQPVVFGKEYGNLVNPWLKYDYRESASVVYAAGQGEQSDRVLVTATDTGRLNSSVWGRRELFVDARNEAATAGVTAKAQAALAQARPYVRFAGTLLDTPQSRYGLDWQYGDRVTCTYQGLQFDGMVRAVEFAIGGDGQEEIRARVEVEA